MGLDRRPRGGACRVGFQWRQLKKRASSDKPASRARSWYLVIFVASFLTITVEVGARTEAPSGAPGGPQQPLRSACVPPQGARSRPERAPARAVVRVACVERAGPRRAAARWSRGRPSARSAEAPI